MARSSADLIMPPQPYYIPGYTGHSPQSKFLCGSSKSRLSHRILVNGAIKSPYLVLADIKHHSRNETPSTACRINQNNAERDFVYYPPLTQGYAGFVPYIQHIVGTTITKARTMGIRKFDDEQKKLSDFYWRLHCEAENCKENRPVPLKDYTDKITKIYESTWDCFEI